MVPGGEGMLARPAGGGVEEVEWREVPDIVDTDRKREKLHSNIYYNMTTR